MRDKIIKLSKFRRAKHADKTPEMFEIYRKIQSGKVKAKKVAA